MADLRVNSDGLCLANPFLVGSGPPSTNAVAIRKAFEAGWGGVVAKTVCLDASKIVNVWPRYARLRTGVERKIVGWENIDLISDRPLEVWLEEFRELKDAFPDRVLIASIMEELSEKAWQELAGRCEEAGVDGFELNLSCPHGLPERRMGAAMGQDPEVVEDVCAWVTKSTSLPVWAKLTPNVMDISEPARAAFEGGCRGVSAINTILCVMGVDLETLRPMPAVEGHSTAGGYSGMAVRPIAQRMVMQCSTLRDERWPDRTVSGLGGIETGSDAAQFLLLGANTLQVCTGIMIHGYGMIRELCSGLGAFMDRHGFATIDEFRGRSLRYFTSHADLVERQAMARRERGGGVEGSPLEEGEEALRAGE